MQAQLEEPSKTLLIFTQTGVDAAGRRHSVSIPLLPRGKAGPDTATLTIQRKGSTSRKRSCGAMESIEERGAAAAGGGGGGGMDCLTVPGSAPPSSHLRKQRKMSSGRLSVRQNSLPAKPESRKHSPAPARSHGSLKVRGSSGRPAKQEFYQFLDSAIAH